MSLTLAPVTAATSAAVSSEHTSTCAGDPRKKIAPASALGLPLLTDIVTPPFGACGPGPIHMPIPPGRTRRGGPASPRAHSQPFQLWAPHRTGKRTGPPANAEGPGFHHAPTRRYAFTATACRLATSAPGDSIR